MNRSVMVLGLVAALLLLAACAPTSTGAPAGQAGESEREDVAVLVYASPL